MKQLSTAVLVSLLSSLSLPQPARAAEPAHPLQTWVKRHPLPAATQPSPRLGYETSYGFDRQTELLVRYGGHNQGGGGEQNSEVWTYDLAKDRWTHKQPTDAPPGVCCAQQNCYHDALRKFVRFPAASGGHGWQSPREIALKNSSAWTYDLDSNAWRAMRPCPEVWPAMLRGAAYEPQSGLIVIHGGEGANYGTVAYDLYANAWIKLDPKGEGPKSSLSQAGFAYDAVNGVFVLFGSQFESDPRTWLYDVRENRWTVLETADHPPADKSCPILAADTRSGVVLCSVIGADGLETWVLDVAKRSWTRLRVPAELPKSGSRNRAMLYLEDQNLFVIENNTNGGAGQPREQQMWTFRYADAPPPAPAPRDVRASATSDGVLLTWAALPSDSKGRYNVYRIDGEEPWRRDARLVAAAVEGTQYADKDVKPAGVYAYQVRSIDAPGNEGAASTLVRAQPPVPVDVVVSNVSAKRAELSWPAVRAGDVAGYHVERAVVSVYSNEQAARVGRRYAAGAEAAVGGIKAIGEFERLTPTPIKETRFADESIDLAAGMKEPAGKPIGGRPLTGENLNAAGKAYPLGVYAYRVRAVNGLGVVGGPSPIVYTFPAAVRDVAAREEGKSQTRLRWAASKQAGIKGYLVYRQEGQYDKEPIVRLTPAPIAATEFLDESSGEVTRRYEVVAVDELGQEGEPSQPIWSRRQWRKFYEPYVGEWHQ